MDKVGDVPFLKVGRKPASFFSVTDSVTNTKFCI
jgi:hypothetical protein